MENNIIIEKIGKMVHMKNIKVFLKRLICSFIVIYCVITFFKQQKLLNNYLSQTKNVELQIQEATKKQQLLNEKKANVNSNEFIESIAREKLDMYLPNERVYVDNEK